MLTQQISFRLFSGRFLWSWDGGLSRPQHLHRKLHWKMKEYNGLTYDFYNMSVWGILMLMSWITVFNLREGGFPDERAFVGTNHASSMLLVSNLSLYIQAWHRYVLSLRLNPIHPDEHSKIHAAGLRWESRVSCLGCGTIEQEEAILHCPVKGIYPFDFPTTI